MYIVTDLTEFNKNGLVCMAAVEVATLDCIRPLPYLTLEYCQFNHILPGSIIHGTILRTATSAPHIEDVRIENLTHLGQCNAHLFHQVLKRTACTNLEAGFGGPIPYKMNPSDQPAQRSLITYKPNTITIEENDYETHKLRINFDHLRNVALKDLRYLMHYNLGPGDDKVKGYNHFLESQEEVYLRLGLSRCFEQGERKGHWLQVNGIYTFPKSNPEVRRYA